MNTVHYRSPQLADRIEALLAAPHEPGDDALTFTFEIVETPPEGGQT